MRIIAFSNQKGGTGKTTSTINTGFALALLGYQVLLIDLDPQANLTCSLGINTLKIPQTVGQLLLDGSISNDLVVSKGNVQLIPSTPDLHSLESELYLKSDGADRLKRCLANLEHYDFILIDCPPSAGIFTQNALLAATEIFIPVQTEYLALQGMSQLLTTVDNIKNGANPDLKLGGIIATRYNQRKVLNREVIEKLQQHFGYLLFNTIIRENISLAEAPSYGMDIFSYRPNSSGAKDYRSLAVEIIERG